VSVDPNDRATDDEYASGVRDVVVLP